MTGQHQQLDWDRRAVVQAFIGEVRVQGPGQAAPRVAGGLVVIVIVILALMLAGYLTKSSAHGKPASPSVTTSHRASPSPHTAPSARRSG